MTLLCDDVTIDIVPDIFVSAVDVSVVSEAIVNVI